MSNIQPDQGAQAARAVLDVTPNAQAGSSGTLRELVAAQESEIRRALPRHLDAGRFVRIIQTELRKTPALMKATPQSFLGAVLTAAQLGLEIGAPMGRAYLVPFRNNKTNTDEVQLIIGYKGWLDLVHRGGEIADLQAHAVHESDVFEYEYGAKPNLIHRPARGERGNVTEYYCVAHTKSGGMVFEVMSVADVLKHRERYAKKDRSGDITGPWATHFDEMALKTVFKKVYTWLPMTTEQALAATVDEGMVIRQSNSLTHVPEPEVVFDDEDVVDAEVVEKSVKPKAPARKKATAPPVEVEPERPDADEWGEFIAAVEPEETQEARDIAYEARMARMAERAKTSGGEKELEDGQWV